MNFKILISCCLLCISSSVTLLASPDTIETDRVTILEKHRFIRDTFSNEVLELQTGNGEMGGLVANSGLGIEIIWCSDLWENEANRIPLQGIQLRLEDLENIEPEIASFSQQLSLADAVVETSIRLSDERSFESKLFFSSHEKRLLVFQIKNTSASRSLKGVLQLPIVDYQYTSDWPDYNFETTDVNRFQIRQVGENEFEGTGNSSLFTSGAWRMKLLGAAKDFSSETGSLSLEIEPGKEATVFLMFTTEWTMQSPHHVNDTYLKTVSSYEQEFEKHQLSWLEDWSKTTFLSLPDHKHEELFYRSIFWLFCTSGSEKFLPGEGQFASACWNMRPFTYGAAGWAALSFAHLGHFEKAKKMLINYYSPEGLIENSKRYLNTTNGNAYSFAHEIKTDGTTTGVCDEQRHVNGFALALFHKYYLLTADEAFLSEYLVPVAAGVADFWSELAEWDETRQAFIFPKLRSVSEDLFEKSLLDVVLSAKWSLEIAISYKQDSDSEKQKVQKWEHVLKHLYVPQNDEVYLEFLDDNESREYASYQGIRAPVYLGYPSSELSESLDKTKAIRTLKHTWTRNHRGDGMLGFIASWYALSAQQYGLGDLALEMAEQNFNCYDPSGTALCEGPHNLDRYYFLTTTASYIMFPLNMLTQVTAEGFEQFPAVPSKWKSIRFEGLPIGNGIFASGYIDDDQRNFTILEP